MDSSNMAMLSMEHRKQFITIYITVSPLIQSALGKLLDTRNAATASKPNITGVTTVLK